MKNVFKLTMLMVLSINTLWFTSCDNDDDPIPNVELADTKWSFKAFDLGDIWTDALDDVTVNLEFKNDGKIQGTAGCNSFSGTYTITGNAIKINADTVTLVACEENISTQETNFIDGLKNSKTVVIEGNQLRLYATVASGLILEKIASAN